MSENFKVLTQFVKDLSSETPDIETYLYVKDYLPNYNLDIDITSKAMKNMMIEVNTKLTFIDKGKSKRKSFFEINYVSIVKINENERIILCDVQNEIYPNLEKIFENLLNDSGYRGIKIQKKIDFEKLYNQKIN
jgi:preprotein translocase subunit SecB